MRSKKYKRQLKVYGTAIFPTNLLGQCRAVVAARSKAEAAHLFGVSQYYMNEYGCETRNAKEVAAAMSKPGTVSGYLLSGAYEQQELIELTVWEATCRKRK